MSSVFLLGLDIGSTTTHLMIAKAELVKNCVTGRMEFGSPKVIFKSEPEFTPFSGSEISLGGLTKLITHWLTQSKIEPGELNGGGAIVTGLASKKENARKIKGLVRQLVGQSIVATAEDPHLESWLAFQGNCHGLLESHPHENFLNFDIGGGTTNLAWGANNAIQSTGCLFIGARHFQFYPGTYRLKEISDFGYRILHHLSIQKNIGETLEQSQVQNIVNEYISALEAVATNKLSPKMPELYDYTLEMQLKRCPSDCTFVFSGGVAELLYQYAQGQIPETKAAFGDLGEDFALGILESKILSKDLQKCIPSSLGRATVFGMTLYQVDVSGSTTYLSSPELLPMEDIPIVTTIDLNANEEKLLSQLQLLSHSGKKVGAFVLCSEEKAREQFIRLALLLKLPEGVSLALFLESNLGKTLGNYLTDWGKASFSCVVVDEVPLKSAQFASLGRMLQNSIPVSFYGMK